jgi:multidrug efflux pump subunit AcrB
MNDPQPGGTISLFTRHRVAGNLLMALMLLFGTWGLMNLNRQVMPDFTLDVIQIIVEWPGASPEDLEANVVKAIEPEVRFLDGARRVIAVASASRAEVTVEFEEGVDISGALADVQAAVARITTFPTDIERPVVRQFTSYESVCRIEIAGPFPEGALKALARVMRDDLLDLGAAHIDLQGVRDSEIWVELRREVLRRLDMRCRVRFAASPWRGPRPRSAKSTSSSGPPASGCNCATSPESSRRLPKAA